MKDNSTTVPQFTEYPYGFWSIPIVRLCKKVHNTNMYATSTLTLPVVGIINAGWPSPAEEELLDTISFDEWLIEPSTFMVKVQNDAMQNAGIFTDDVVIFRRGQKPKSGDIVIADVEGQWMMRYYAVEEGKPVLYPANGHYEVIRPDELTIIGVIRSVIRKYSC